MATVFSVLGEIKNPKLRRLMHQEKRSKRRVLDEEAWEVLQRHSRSDGKKLDAAERRTANAPRTGAPPPAKFDSEPRSTMVKKAAETTRPAVAFLRLIPIHAATGGFSRSIV